MKQDIADQWVAALRSGKYKQGKHRLRNQYDEFCCLGVLCDLHAQAHPEIAASQTHECQYLGQSEVLPDAVVEWAGLDSRRGSIGNDSVCSLVDDNDNGATFDQLADKISACWSIL